MTMSIIQGWQKSLVYNISVFALILLVSCVSHETGRRPDDSGPVCDFKPVVLTVFYFSTTQEELRPMAQKTLKTLVAELAKMPEFLVFGQDEVDRIIAEQKSSMAPGIDSRKYPVAQLMCHGSISRLGSEIRIKGRLMAAKTSKIVLHVSAKGADESKAMKTFVKELQASIRNSENYQAIRDISTEMDANG